MGLHRHHERVEADTDASPFSLHFRQPLAQSILPAQAEFVDTELVQIHLFIGLQVVTGIHE